MQIPVPYYSQYLDVMDPAWQPRACGLVCLKMLLEASHVQTPSLDEMLTQGEAIGAYGEWGWRHDGLVALGKQYGARLSRVEWRESEIKSGDELNEEGVSFLVAQLRARRPVAVSAIKNFEITDKFHMVVLTGYEEENGGVTGFYYHDSDTKVKGAGENLFVPIDTFSAKWRRMAIY